MEKVRAESGFPVGPVPFGYQVDAESGVATAVREEAAAVTGVFERRAAGDTNGQIDIFTRDMSTGEIKLVSNSSSGAEGNGATYLPTISDDGTKVAFSSYSTNLVPQDTNRVADVFVRDLIDGSLERVSTRADGDQDRPNESYRLDV